MRYLVLAVLVGATPVGAQPVASNVAAATERTTTVAPVDPDWAAAPSPREASGVLREDARPARDRVLWLPRALLFVPRVALWAVAQPVHGAVYAYDHYDGPSPTSGGGAGGISFGISPVLVYETGFGFTFGGRVVARDVLGAAERVKLRADFGGRFQQAYGLTLTSGERFGEHLTLEVDGSYERRRRERFFGIGNADTLEASPTMPLDPSLEAIDARYRDTLVTTALTADLRLADHLHARTSGTLQFHDLSSDDDEDSLATRYDTEQLPGFARGVDNLAIEQALVYDTRRAGKYQSKVFDATGWYLEAHAGITRGIDGDPSKFTSYGGEVKRYFDLYDGSRVLVVRALVEAIDGTAAFVDLPQLGGAERLRGYPDGRFRDRAVALGGAEYAWDLGNFFAAFTFVDIGRTYASLDELDARALRIGFGGGVQVHTTKSFVMRTQLAGSREGDFFFQLAIAPASGRREPRSR